MSRLPQSILQHDPSANTTDYQAHYSRGCKYLSKVVALDGRPRKMLWWLGRYRARRAIAEFIICLSLEPTSWPCMWSIGKSYQALNQHGWALQWMEKACAIEKDNADVFREASIECMALGLGEKAVKYASLALKLRIQDAGMHANYALAQLINRNGDEASLAIAKACIVDPLDPVTNNVKALIDRVLSKQQRWPDRIAT